MYWKKWAAKHEPEELKEGARIEPALALLRKKSTRVWTETHLNVARKSLGRRLQKRLFDMAGRMYVNANHARWRKEMLYHSQKRHEVRREILEPFRKWEQKAKTSKKDGSGKEV